MYDTLIFIVFYLFYLPVFHIFTHFSCFYSIEFDRDCDYFAIAGVTKKIKVCINMFK